MKPEVLKNSTQNQSLKMVTDIISQLTATLNKIEKWLQVHYNKNQRKEKESLQLSPKRDLMKKENILKIRQNQEKDQDKDKIQTNDKD